MRIPLLTLAVLGVALLPADAQAQARKTSLSSAAAAANTDRDEPVDGTFAVRCGRLLRGDGTAVDDAWLVIRDGKVVSAGQAAPPADMPVLDASNRVVMPGIVAVDTDLSGAVDDAYAITPDMLAIDGFDFDRKLRDALEGGVTTAYLSPGRQRLVSGQGAVIKTHGDDLVERVLDETACLRMNFGDGGVSAPRVFEPGVHPTDDDPLEPARIQTPTARISQLAELRALLAEATAAQGALGEGSSENRYDPEALKAVIEGTMPVRAAATKASDIRRALMFAEELGLKMVLENPQEIAPLAARAGQQAMGAVFRMPVRPGSPSTGGEDRRQKLPPRRLDAPARAADAGLKVGVAPGPGMPLRDYLLAVGLAVRGGMERDQAMRAVGSDAALILGVADRVGTLEPGKDADFVVLSGDPLAIGTMVESTWVSGHRAYQRQNDSNMLAIRCGKILDGNGRVYRDGVLIIENGRVQAVGEDLSIPYGARTVELPDAVMTPGFVDAFSHLGLAGEGTGVPRGAANQKIADAIPFDDPMFAPALAAGVTTVLTSGKDGGLVSGRIAAVKTGADDHEDMVVREIAGQRAVFDAVGPDAIKPLRDQITAAKKYAEQWTKYEKALEEWRTGKKPAEDKPKEEPKPEAEAEDKPAKKDPVTGTWEAELDLQGRFQIGVIIDLKLDGTKVTGTVTLRIRDRELPPQDVENGSYEDGKLKLEFTGMGGTAAIEGTIEGDTFTGTIGMGPMGEQELTAKRTGGSAAKKPTAQGPTRKKGEPEDKPKAPKVNEAQEPMRAVVEGRAALVVRAQRASAIEAVVELLEKEQLPYVLHDPKGVIDDPDVLGGNKPAVMVGPAVVRRDGRKLENEAAQLAALDLPLLFGTGACAGARDLPLHAAYAVRYGLGPDEALAALTANAAAAFQLDDRIGSLDKGKDADFVVFSGDPFEPTSRVLLVGCNGDIAVDNREDDSK